MRLLFAYDEAIAGFVGEGLGIIIHPPFTAIGVLSGDEVVGGMVFNNFNGSNVDLTVYTVKPATRGIIRAAAHYCFVQLGCNRVSATTRRANKRANAAIRKLGFVYEATRKQWFGQHRSDDGIAYVLTRKNAGKWL